VKRKLPNIKDTILRSLMLRCPACGKASIVQRPFRIAEHCSSCGAHFKREEGFFVGAILINVVITEAVIVMVYLISIPWLSFESQKAIAGLFVIALLFPVAFYHHSWGIWLGFDHFVEGLPHSRVPPR
jgi:uncharacterized protein (DUF983 family)